MRRSAAAAATAALLSGGAWPAGCEAASGQESHRVAICLRGALRGGPEVLESIEERVLKPLDADAFVYVALHRYAPAEGQKHGSLRSPTPEELLRLAALPGLRSLHLEAEDATALLEAEVRRRQRQGGSAAAEAVLRSTRAVGGSWLGGLQEPLPGGRPGEFRPRPRKGLHIMLAWHRCLAMVEQAEDEAGGQPYDWIVDTRLDTFWEYPHVPVQLLSQDAIWIPEGSDFGGVNDRHAVIPRRRGDGDGAEEAAGRLSASEMYLGSWRFVAEGKAALLMHELLGRSGVPVEDTGCDLAIDGPVQQPCANSEVWLAMRLRAQEIRVKRLPGLSWITCSAKLDGGARLHMGREECFGEGSRFQYEEEFKAAKTQSMCLRGQLGELAAGWGDGSQGALALGHDAIRHCWCPSEVRRHGSFDSGFQEHDFFALCS